METNENVSGFKEKREKNKKYAHTLVQEYVNVKFHVKEKREKILTYLNLYTKSNYINP